MKHGTTPPVFIDGKHPPTPTTDGHPTPIPTEYVPTPPSEASQPSGIDTPPVPEPQTEHFRAALSNDPETHRASNVYDWSTDALRDAGHEAGLTNTEIANITHNRHNIAQVNGSFYDQNHAVRDDPHHYLSADPRHNKYDVTEQQSTAHDIANAWKAEHHPEAASTAAQPNTDGTQTYGSGMPSADVTSETKVDVDKELQRLLDEINAENQPAVAAPVVPKEVLLGLTERELRNVQAAIGVIATTTLIPLTFRAYGRQRDRRLANERQNEWGDNGKGQPVQNHRAFYNRAPTVPNRAKPAAWFASHKVKPVETVTA
jgi:hypothetical protein